MKISLFIYPKISPCKKSSETILDTIPYLKTISDISRLSEKGKILEWGSLVHVFSKKYTECCSTLPSPFACIFHSSQTISEDVFLEDEWLDFLSLGRKGAWWGTRLQKWEFSLFQFLMKRKLWPVNGFYIFS